MLKVVFVVFFTLGLSLPASAKDGSSGCGPGWYFLKERTFVSSFLRLTTNALLSPLVTLGMTFGTSNCSKHGLVNHDKKSLHLVTMTFDQLRQEVAMGQGEFLEAYRLTFGCAQSAQLPFRKSLQENFEKIFSDKATPDDIVGRTRMILQNNAELSGSCASV